MNLRNSSNKPLIETMLYIGKNVVKNVAKDNDKVGFNSKIDKELGYSILNTSYSRMFRKEQTKSGSDIAGIIRPKFNSIFTLIDYKSVTNHHLDTNYPLASSTTIDAITKKLNNEVSKYIFNYLPKVKSYGYKVDAYIKKMDVSVNISDDFNIKLLEFTDLVDVLIEKNMLTKYVFTNTATTEKPVIELNRSLRDLELNLLYKELYDNDISRDDELSLYINNIVSSETTDAALSIINRTHGNLKYYNANIYLLILLADVIRSEEYSTDIINNYKELYNAIVENVIDNNILIDRIRTVDILVYSIVTENDVSTLTLIGDVYRKFVNENGKIKAVYGRHINILNNDGLEYVVMTTKDDIMYNSDEYVGYVNKYISNKQLIHKNNIREYVTNYWVMGLAVVTTEDVIDNKREAIVEYLNDLTLTQLTDTNNTALDILTKFIYNESNFDIFIKAYNEALLLTKSEDKEYLVAYATYKLVLLYLVDQTYIV